MLLGVAIRATTQPHGQGFLRVLLGASALLELAGILLFAGIVASVFWRARTKREPYDRFLEVATAWLVVLGGMNAYLTIHAAVDGRHVLAAAGDAALLEAAVYGFVVLFVLGVSYRALPFFLSLRPAYAPLRDAALAIIAVALPLRVAAVWAPEFGRYGWAARTDQLSTFALAIGVAAAAAALRVFESPAEDAPAVEAPPAFRQMVQAAYVWLLAGVALDSYWRLRELSGGFTPFYAAGAVRHAFLLGFATLMLMAMAYRTVPVFSGRPLRWRAGIPASFLMVLGAGVLRVFPVALTLVPSKLDFKLLTAAGVLLFCGLAVLFAELLSSMFARFAATPAAAALANATTTQTTPAVAAASAARAPAATPAPAAHRAAPATHTNGAVPAANANGTSPVPVANGAAGPVRREMTVADALALSPRVLPALIEYGFGPLTDPGLRARMAPVTTIERAAAIVNVDPDALVASLNKAVGDARAESIAPAETDDGVAPIDMRFTDTAAPEAMVRFALKSCYDPEIPINIVDLGLVYAVAVEGTHAYVRMTLTAPGCPMADEVEVQVRDAMLGVPGIESVDVDVVTAPPWTPERMSAAAKRAVGWQ
jgi:metal-sulfur cluster biosynthetic enzyme